MAEPFRVGFVTGATPDKWARIWRERHPRDPFELVPVDQDHQETLLRDGDLEMCLVRQPIDRDGLHLIPLYEEVQVAVLSDEHEATLLEELTLDDLVDEQLVIPHPSGWTPSAAQQDWPEMSVRDAIAVVASGTGVAIVPMALARLHSRRDVTFRPVTDLPPTSIGLAWRIADDEDPWVHRFIGIVRGRTERSSRE
jgi:DNA-binding transcriptional LysR family regulator